VAYYDGSNDGKATVMKFDGSNWVPVGSPGFSAGIASDTSFAAADGRLYVAYQDSATDWKRATVMTFVDVPDSPDTIPPNIETFAVVSPFSGPNIGIKAFTASDLAGVTGYMITKIPFAPDANDPGWSEEAPTTYTVESSGLYTLYPWAKDAAGNVSALSCSAASVRVDATPPDVTPPTVISFTATSPSSSFNIPITAFTASDDTGITGYKISLSSTPPAAGDPGWSTTAPITYTVGAEGNYTLYPWAKDTAGNVSALYGSPASVQVDLPPYVVSFIAASPSSSLDIPIIQFTASDSVGVTGYMITASSTPPVADDPDWSGTAPSTYTVGAEGNYTLYPWAKDTAGNVSQVWDPVPVSVVIHTPVTLIVTNNADGGAGSLRKAIADSSPGDTITFAPSLSGATITLASTLTIDKSLTIDGSSLTSPVAISGADAHRVFYIGGEVNSILVTLNSLTIRNGYLSEDAGAGIANEGALTVTNSTLSGNFAGIGGGIYNAGILTVTNSTISGNSASWRGGGIYNIREMTVANSTISGNAAIGEGGGIYNDATATVINSTLAGNSADWGGGIYNVSWGTLDYFNTIVANSILGDDVVNLDHSSSKNNWVGTLSLGPLADNGGPTQTMALPDGSPAIDAGDDATCASADQRGVTRPQGSHCDIGAYEYQGDTTAPAVLSITRASPNHTSSASVAFMVTFSEPVTHVDAADFNLAVTGGINGMMVSSVSGSGSVRTITVNTGSGNGTLRLDISANASITDLNANPIGGLPFTGGETYMILKSSEFSDVPTSYWASSFIERLYAAGITGGCSLNPLNYCPEATVTRAQMAVFLLRGIHGSTYNPAAVGGSTGFIDVPADYWAGAWIKQLAAEGITGGCGAGLYCPEGAVTRAQMAVFLLRSKYGSSYNPPPVGGSTGFSDVPATYWAATWIKQLVAEGITSGCGVGTYCPEAPVTRAQMAVFLVRTFSLP
jgi:hypothetical protein